MRLRADQLHDHLGRKLAPLYVLHGDEPLLVIEAGDAIRAAARAGGYTEREVFVAGAGFRWSDLRLAAGNLSLFGGNKLIDLRIPTGKPGREGGEALSAYCERLHPDVLTLVSLPQLDWQARKAVWFLALQAAGVTIELNAPPLERLPAWIADRLALQQQSASAEALEFIAAHVEGNLLAAHQEIQKLGLLYPKGALALEQVEDAVLHVARYDIDSLRAALVEGDPGRCARLLDGLRGEGAAAPLVLWAFAQELRVLAAIRRGLDSGSPLGELLRQARIADERQARAVGAAARRMSGRALGAAFSHAARIDRMIKGLRRGDIWDEFLLLALRLVPRPETGR